MSDRDVKVEPTLMFEEPRVLHVADLSYFLILSTLLAEYLPLLLDAVVNVLLELPDKLLSGVPQGENMRDIKKHISDGLVYHVAVSWVVQLRVEHLLVVLEGVLYSQNGMR